MAFNPGGGGGSSVAGSSDVSLSQPQDNQVLAYDSDTAKWRNLSSSGLPNMVMATSGTVRPTSNPSVTVIFKGNDPGGNALSGDIWLGAV